MKSPPKIRLDELLVKRGLAETRHQAQIMIRMGKVLTPDRRLEKPGQAVPEDLEIVIDSGPKYVSRGGYKLEGALQDLQLTVTDWICIDVGSSTGGFTDCLLQKGAQKVYAVDVGKHLLHERLLADPRVISVTVNARHLTSGDISEKADLITIDVSFIGIAKLIPALAPLIRSGGLILSMVKPQFECEPRQAPRGVVRNPDHIRQAVDRVAQAFIEAGFHRKGDTPSRVTGPKGNREQFLLMQSGPG
ncbi:MAG TPA: TlyA family RNA methyltransferase [Thermoanaerobaculia bacterium]|nr:TlyA family RNA methyltransferase [Thermoanaerobaculia bacterium]HUM28731.1 TlyA family RNA methyltransferase [Thermoanaerobaculia bacterium]HXK68019.1 TlyA family RNA methyltransferase [Thermoanaerobaculia bacterium]